MRVLKTLPFRGDDVADVELLEHPVFRRFEHVLSRIDLGLALAVLDMDKSALAEIPEGNDPSCNADALFHLFEVVVGNLPVLLLYLLRGNIRPIVLGIGLYSALPQAFSFSFRTATNSLIGSIYLCSFGR